VAHHLTSLPSGAEVGFSAAGDPLAERLVLLCLPTPGAGIFDPDPAVTSRWGVHLVSLDRPGYGATLPLAEDADDAGDAPWRIQDRADDLAAFLVESKRTARQSSATVFGPAGVVGWGTGGMVALSLAARHPELVDRVATIQTAGPHGLSFDPTVVGTPPFRPSALGVADDDPLLERPGLRNRLERMLDEASLQGDAGVRLDRRALADASWSDELGSITAEVRLVYADDLTDVDRYDGYWYRHRIPGARVVRVSSGGHLAVSTEWDRILAHVAPDHGGLSEQTRNG
jgi:pimeloyl-ACP methyl ester carboxylesterase